MPKLPDPYGRRMLSAWDQERRVAWIEFAANATIGWSTAEEYGSEAARCADALLREYDKRWGPEGTEWNE